MLSAREVLFCDSLDAPTIRYGTRRACVLAPTPTQTRIIATYPGWHADYGVVAYDDVVPTNAVYALYTSWTIAGFLVRTYPVAQLAD